MAQKIISGKYTFADLADAAAQFVAANRDQVAAEKVAAEAKKYAEGWGRRFVDLLTFYKQSGSWKTKNAHHKAFETFGEFTEWFCRNNLKGISQKQGRDAVIRFMLSEGVEGKAIALAIDTSGTTVSNINTGKTGNGAGGARKKGTGALPTKPVTAEQIRNATPEQQAAFVAKLSADMLTVHELGVAHPAWNVPAKRGARKAALV